MTSILPARTLAKALGGDLSSSTRILCPGPGHSPRDRSLAVIIDPLANDGFRVHSFANDPWQHCKDHVRQLAGLPAFAPGQQILQRQSIATSRHTDTAGDDLHRERAAQALWDKGQPPIGTITERYLAARRAPLIPEVLAADAIRHLDDCPFQARDGRPLRLPAMLALLRDPLTNEPVGVHRTALTADGMGRPEIPGRMDKNNQKQVRGRAKGTVVKLVADEEVTTVLAITEGIENALSVLAAGWSPVWACCSAGRIQEFPVIPGIEALTIFGDHDHSGTGQDAARECAARWSRAGREATILLPPELGDDWNDLLGREVAA